MKVMKEGWMGEFRSGVGLDGRLGVGDAPLDCR